MNPERLYSQYRDDALAKQIQAEKYSTFVAMPFRDNFSYRSKEIYEKIILAAAQEADSMAVDLRPFDEPQRIDLAPGVAGVLTEEITVAILESHLFLADLTFQNPNVVLETGVALALKPNKQIILIVQGSVEALGFDIRGNRVIRYDSEGATEAIARAMVAAAGAFEADCDTYIRSLARQLSPDAMTILRIAWQLAQEQPPKSVTPAHMADVFSGFYKREEGLHSYCDGMRELLQHRLVYLDYAPVFEPRTPFHLDVWPTKLGLGLVEYLWHEKRSRGKTSSIPLPELQEGLT